jgi:hypothetical protein
MIEHAKKEKYPASNVPLKNIEIAASDLRLVNSSRKQSLCIPLKETARLMPLTLNRQKC